MANPESRLQIVVCQYLNTVLPDGATYWATMNERQVNRQTGAYLNLMGRKSGVADLIVLHAGQMIAIELKTNKDPVRKLKRTYQSQVQKDWQQTVEHCGASYFVCRSTEDVRAALWASGVPIKEAQQTRGK